MRNLVISLCLVCLALPVVAQDAAPKTGIFTTTFTDRSPLSDPDAMAKITRWPREKMRAYDPADHEFQLVVPEDYDGSEDYGLLVYIHPENRVMINSHVFYGTKIKDLVAKRKLIWVSFKDAGNGVMPNIRLGLALDAVHNVKQRYRIDSDRTYVSGLSGGGRMSCMAGMYYPQVFKGIAPICGSLFYNDVKLPNDPALLKLIQPKPPEGQAVWPRGLIEPKASQLREMKKSQRWALITGSRDYNMPQTQAHHQQGFVAEGFEHAIYLEVPDMAHTYPSAEWYDKALAHLDDPGKGQEQDKPQTGILIERFTERSPHSDPDKMKEVLRWSNQKLPSYEIEKHDFQLIVPKDYDGSEAYGLLVFVHSKSEISLDWFGNRVADVLDKHKLIWVSFNGAGNPVMSNIRMSLALDAVHNVEKRYRIDSERVYLSGVSGGGRMTCMGGIYYPQVFKGAMPIIGSLYFNDVKVPNDPELLALIDPPLPDGATVWPKKLWKPSKRRLSEMKLRQRWAFLAGAKDYNMPEMRAHFEQGFKRDEFRHAHYLEVPGMGHNYPPVEWFEKAIVLLDKPLYEDHLEDLPPADERMQRLAQKRLDVALRTLERDRERGIRALNKLIDDLPNTEAAKNAREKLESLSQ